MLAYVRKNANSAVVWLIIGAIAIVFIFFVDMGRSGSGQYITVNGENHDHNEFMELRREISTRLRREDQTPEAERYAQMAALNELVSRMLTRQFGENLGLSPSPRALQAAVAAEEYFQVDGRFNLERYQTVLKAQGRNPAAFERELRRNLTSERAINLAMGLARTYRPELMDLFHFQEDQVRFDYLFLADEEAPREPGPTDEQLAAYFAVRQEKWRRPAEMTVQYVEIVPADYVDQATFTETELEDFYLQNQLRFQRPEAVALRQILFSFPSLSPDEAEKADALARAEAARSRLAQGAEFEALARELSDDRNTAANGGYLGFLARESTFPELEEAAWNAPLNEVLGPVGTDAGYHLLQVTARRAAGPSPLEEVRAELAEELKILLARQTAVNLLEDLLARAEVNPDLAAAAQSLELRAALSRAFTAADAPGFFENDPTAIQRAFSAPLNKVAPPWEGERTLVLYVPRTRQESRIPPLDEVRSGVEQAWRGEAADSQTRARLESLLPEIRAQGWSDYLATLDSAGPLKSGASPLVNRYNLPASPPFEQSDPQAVTALAFSVAAPGQIVPVSLAGRLDDRSGRFLLRLADYQAADEGRLDGPEGRTFEYLLSLNKSNHLYQVWRLGLLEASKDQVIIPPPYLE